MDFRALIAGVSFAFIWASAFTSARIIVTSAPPIFILSLRFLISGLLAVAVARALGQSWHLSRKRWVSVIIFGVCQNGLYLGLNFVAMQTIDASVAAIIASAMPLLVGFVLFASGRENLGRLGGIGLCGGLAGVVLIMGMRFGGGADVWGIFLCVLAVLSLTGATLVLRTATSGGDLLMLVGLQMLVASASLWPFGMMFETWQVDWTYPVVFAFTYTVIFPGLVATLIWFWLVERIGATRAATFHFLSPVFGVAVAAVILNEALMILDFFGVVIIALGIWAVQTSRDRAKS